MKPKTPRDTGRQLGYRFASLLLPEKHSHKRVSHRNAHLVARWIMEKPR